MDMQELATGAKVKTTQAKVKTTQAKVGTTEVKVPDKNGKVSMVCCIAYPIPFGFVYWVCFGVCF
jgi:hypothetical protein